MSIRSIQINGDVAEAFAGCGIVKGSTPSDEWGEAHAKLQNIWGPI